jgi:hypothetical protein
MKNELSGEGKAAFHGPEAQAYVAGALELILEQEITRSERSPLRLKDYAIVISTAFLGCAQLHLASPTAVWLTCRYRNRRKRKDVGC